MEHVVLVIHLILTLALIVLILLQRSEGGGLGLGTGGGLGNFATAQSTANALTRATTFVAVGFFVTSIILAILASRSGASQSILDAASSDSVPAITQDAPVTPAEPVVPVDGAKAVDAPAAPAADKAASDAAASGSAAPDKANSEPPTVPISK